MALFVILWYNLFNKSTLFCRAGFLKVDQLASLSVLSSKGATEGPLGHILDNTFDILELLMKSKKKP